MSYELVLNGKTYISSKRAAEATGYARDYIGQLSRSGQIEAERVGGLWYVSMESLKGYEKNAELAKSLPVSPGSREAADSVLNFEGKEYISASRASKLTGYNQDYVGQLARGGKIPSRQIGNRWYVDREALVGHKKEKDALLAAVQAEAVGLKQATSPEKAAFRQTEHVLSLPKVTYMTENRDLLPHIPEKKETVQYPVSNVSELGNRNIQETPKAPHQVAFVPPVMHKPAYVAPRTKTRSKKGYVAASASLLTIILVLSVGVVASKHTAVFASIQKSQKLQAMTASAAGFAGAIGDVIEDIVSPELVYNREN